VLFLYRPRETWMPFALPRNTTQQAAYNRQLQAKFESTRRVPPAVPAAGPQVPIAKLKELGALHQAGDLTDEEFAIAKAKLLGS
jgi:Short C-terminal domain